jgi:hypothetical protein
MASAFDKQHSSRPNRPQTVSYVGGASGGPVVCSSPFGTATQQVRLSATVAGWFSIDQSTSATLVTSANIPATGFFLPASVEPEYLTVTQGQIFSFCSTSTSSGYVSLGEMA